MDTFAGTELTKLYFVDFVDFSVGIKSAMMTIFKAGGRLLIPLLIPCVIYPFTHDLVIAHCCRNNWDCGPFSKRESL